MTSTLLRFLPFYSGHIFFSVFSFNFTDGRNMLRVCFFFFFLHLMRNKLSQDCDQL